MKAGTKFNPRKSDTVRRACVWYGARRKNGNKTHENHFLLQKRNFYPTKHTRYIVITVWTTLALHFSIHHLRSVKPFQFHWEAELLTSEKQIENSTQRSFIWRVDLVCFVSLDMYPLKLIFLVNKLPFSVLSRNSLQYQTELEFKYWLSWPIVVIASLPVTIFL